MLFFRSWSTQKPSTNKVLSQIDFPIKLFPFSYFLINLAKDNILNLKFIYLMRNLPLCPKHNLEMSLFDSEK